VLCLRLSNQGPRLGKSLILKIRLEDIDAGECQWLGWERNERAKLGPRLTNLSNSMDPKKYVDLARGFIQWMLICITKTAKKQKMTTIIMKNVKIKINRVPSSDH
jgi:Ubiquitin-like modifier-activating enzyme ATG7 N-terminus